MSKTFFFIAISATVIVFPYRSWPAESSRGPSQEAGNQPDLFSRPPDSQPPRQDAGQNNSSSSSQGAGDQSDMFFSRQGAGPRKLKRLGGPTLSRQSLTGLKNRISEEGALTDSQLDYLRQALYDPQIQQEVFEMLSQAEIRDPELYLLLIQAFLDSYKPQNETRIESKAESSHTMDHAISVTEGEIHRRIIMDILTKNPLDEAFVQHLLANLWKSEYWEAIGSAELLSRLAPLDQVEPAYQVYFWLSRLIGNRRELVVSTALQALSRFKRRLRQNLSSGGDEAKRSAIEIFKRVYMLDNLTIHAMTGENFALSDPERVIVRQIRFENNQMLQALLDLARFDSSVKELALIAVGLLEYENPAFVGYIKELLSSSEPDKRRLGAQAINMINMSVELDREREGFSKWGQKTTDYEITQTLIILAEDTDPLIRESALKALSYINPRSASFVHVFVSRLEDPHPRLRGLAIWALGRSQTQDLSVIARLETILISSEIVHFQSMQILAHTIRALGELGAKANLKQETIQKLEEIALFQAKEDFVAMGLSVPALEALGKIQAKNPAIAQALPEVFSRLNKNQELWFSLHLSSVLPDLTEEAQNFVAGKIEELLSHENPAFRESGAYIVSKNPAFLKIRPGAKQKLVSLLSDPEQNVRQAAVFAVSRRPEILRANPIVGEELVSLLSDSSFKVRELAFLTLRQNMTVKVAERLARLLSRPANPHTKEMIFRLLASAQESLSFDERSNFFFFFDKRRANDSIFSADIGISLSATRAFGLFIRPRVRSVIERLAFALKDLPLDLRIETARLLEENAQNMMEKIYRGVDRPNIKDLTKGLSEEALRHKLETLFHYDNFSERGVALAFLEAVSAGGVRALSEDLSFYTAEEALDRMWGILEAPRPAQAGVFAGFPALFFFEASRPAMAASERANRILSTSGPTAGFLGAPYVAPYLAGATNSNAGESEPFSLPGAERRTTQGFGAEGTPASGFKKLYQGNLWPLVPPPHEQRADVCRRLIRQIANK